MEDSYRNALIIPGISWQILIYLTFSLKVVIFAAKMIMDKARVASILNNASDDYLERFFETMLNEINCDDEPYNKKARQILLASLNNEHADDFFIAVCGWSLV